MKGPLDEEVSNTFREKRLQTFDGSTTPQKKNCTWKSIKACKTYPGPVWFLAVMSSLLSDCLAARPSIIKTIPCNEREDDVLRLLAPRCGK